MRPLLALMAFSATLVSCGPADRITAEEAWIRLPAVAGRPGAAYFTARVSGKDDALVAVSTPVAKRTELHESMGGAGGMMSMRPLASVPAKAGEAVSFAPGGRHVMLFDMTPGLQPGSESKLTLRFASGREATVPVRVVGAGEAAPE